MARDDVGFELWYREVHGRLVTVIAAAIGDTDLARDVVDDALTRAFEAWPRVSRMDSPTGWAYRVALHLAYRRSRRRRLETRLLRRLRTESVPGPTGELWLLVDRLPRRQREAVLLRHVGDLTERQVAEVMQVARGTVSSLLRTAYRRLDAEVRSEKPCETELDHDRP